MPYPWQSQLSHAPSLGAHSGTAADRARSLRSARDRHYISSCVATCFPSAAARFRESACVRACVCARVRACVRACVCALIASHAEGTYHSGATNSRPYNRYIQHMAYSAPWLVRSGRVRSDPEFLARTTPLRRMLLGETAVMDAPGGSYGNAKHAFHGVGPLTDYLPSADRGNSKL